MDTPRSGDEDTVGKPAPETGAAQTGGTSMSSVAARRRFTVDEYYRMAEAGIEFPHTT